MGYHRAGFDVVGVDTKRQRHYPFPFIQADALQYVAEHGREYDAIHASPPCQAYSRSAALHTNLHHPKLIVPTRAALRATELPYVIENVVGAPLLSPIVLCGTMFGLKVFRHRLFESNLALLQERHAVHSGKTVKSGGEYVSVFGHEHRLAEGRAAMGIDWMNRDELAQAIPPAYTEYVGRQLL